MTRDQALALTRRHLHAATGLAVDPLPWVVDAVMEAAERRYPATVPCPACRLPRDWMQASRGCAAADCPEVSAPMHQPDWPTESRIDVIGSNGNDGLAYGVRDAGPAAFEGRTTRRESE